MTLRPLDHPLASFTGGTPRIHCHHQDGLAEGRLYRAGKQVCMIWRTPAMPAPAFRYFGTLLEAWHAYRRFREAHA